MFTQEFHRSCCCSKNASSNRRNDHVCEPRVDFVFPEVRFPSRRVFEVAGEKLLRELVHRHHENLLKSQIFYLFPTDKEAMEKLVKRSADFVVEMCGGPDYYTSTRGEPRMRSRHFSVTIDEKAREIWLACYKYALKEVAFPFSVLEEFWQWIESFSIRMINRRTTLEPPRRVYFDEIKNFFTP
ncbi:globin domain-containing protein [Methylacidiphilum caldifontis]|uniref:Globin n=1 Tax=Methylacidiphilum caldifontis TaxID=2795386 RepID=A0A4Y8P7E8_9BACT|nr:globin [Methylacidiphilum caldifontis]QSR88870.1 globin [Methylacidiphilum caldifontis]TFE66233.1 globin [Methylacidiphilum caldifontis]